MLPETHKGVSNVVEQCVWSHFKNIFIATADLTVFFRKYSLVLKKYIIMIYNANLELT